MMHAWEKKIMRLGAMLLAVGALLFAGVLALNGFNFNNFALAASYNRVTHAPEGEFDRLDVSVADADVRLQIAEDGVCRVICDESGRDAYTVEVQDGTLVVRIESHWYDNIGIHLSEPELTLLLPERDYAEVQLHSVSGDMDVTGLRIDALAMDTTSGEIELAKLTLGSLDVETVSGDIEMLDSVASGDVRIRSTSGEIELERADAANFEISTVSGDVEGSLCSGKTFDVHSVSGDVKLPQSASGGTFKASTTSGDVEIRVK
ncbi:MAG: DUF4097 family beta strand repeat-containing protein [Aristaeellaceae bacterium]